ncbi:MAG: PEGA domain-containing protein [Fidelibacterota bacterium]|nr:MAG: PEGA domain-containing protein [Candidatus Neomarinimicrobiota bacterium]
MRRITSAGLCLLVLLYLLAAQEKPTLAVLEFDGFGISDPEIQTLTNRLRTNLTQIDVYRIIERGLMLEILQEQDFQMTGCTSDECAVEVGQLLGAQLMLAGSIGRVGNTWTVEMRIIDVETGAVTKSASYDTRGEIDLVLTEGMGAAARKITGVAAPVEPVTAARPALRPAFLDVTTAPRGAVIFVDDIDKGTTPVSRLELPPGISHDISARLERYHPVDTTLALETGEQARLNLTLQPMMGYLVLAGDGGAKVRLDGRTLGSTPLERLQLQMGLHQLSLTKPEHYRYRAEVAVEYDHITTVNYTLKKKSKGPAVALSLVLPGGGQLYHGRMKGLLYLAASAALSYLGFTSHMDYADEFDNYQTLLDDYNSETDPTLAKQKMDAVQASFDKAKELELNRNIMLGSLGAIWTVSLVDIAF